VAAISSALRVNPARSRVVATFPGGNQPIGLAVRAATVWVAKITFPSGVMTWIDPTGATGTVSVGHHPSAIAADEHAVWVADSARRP
jgi:DNA-binding beta-propeller fold protein YncE